MKDMIPKYHIGKDGHCTFRWVRRFDWRAVAIVALMAALIAATLWCLFGVRP